jgi:8-oxo-dGTP diphosphatase
VDGVAPVLLLSDPAVIVGCCNIVSDGAGRYLFVRETKKSARDRFNLPAGKLEAGETLVDAAEREAREETGLAVTVERLVGVYHCPQTSEGFGVVNFVFASTVVGGTERTSDEHPELRWLTRDEVAALGRDLRLRGLHIERALDAYERGDALPPVETVPPSPLR